jgi:hypothetical protein
VAGNDPVLPLLALLSLACDGGTPPASARTPTADSLAPQPTPQLVLRASGGSEVWFGDARESRDSAGAPCTERTLEIRGPAGRRIVPLLYTLDTPTVLDDSTIRARLYTDCRPGRFYRVNLRTGLPSRKDR